MKSGFRCLQLYVDSTQVLGDCCGSELDNREAGDESEMAQVQSGHMEAKLQCGGSDQEVLEGDDDALGRLLPSMRPTIRAVSTVMG
jgi:hypothetical protein